MRKALGILAATALLAGAMGVQPTNRRRRYYDDDESKPRRHAVCPRLKVLVVPKGHKVETIRVEVISWKGTYTFDAEIHFSTPKSRRKAEAKMIREIRTYVAQVPDQILQERKEYVEFVPKEQENTTKEQ